MLRGFIAAAVVARLVFWTVTNRMFEDGLTTITHSRNVPLGLGLVHHAGEGNVHGFTSAIGVLIPLAGELVHQGSGMFAMRVASLIAVCIALVYARLICRDLRLGAFPTAFVLAYLAFDQNMIFYGMSGMETQVAVTVILGGVYHVRRQDMVASGIWLGLAPLARPEFVLWVAPALAYLALANLRRGIAAGGIAGAVVAPWIVFTTAYYGSPIPNTVVAKATVSPIPAILSNGSPLPWLEWLFGQVTGHIELLLYHFEPFHEVWSTAAAPIPGPVLIVIAVVVADLFAIGLVASRQVAGWWPALAFVGLFFAYRVYFIPTINYYDWYLPPFLALVMIVVAAGLQRIYVWRPMITKSLSVALAFAFAMHVPFSFGVESKVQAVENEVRTNVAEYLGARAAGPAARPARPSPSRGRAEARLACAPALGAEFAARAVSGNRGRVRGRARVSNVRRARRPARCRRRHHHLFRRPVRDRRGREVHRPEKKLRNAIGMLKPRRNFHAL